uniref:guanylate cyclase n=1 Tax=Strigamia maritima TaxID=126957 RepID=T1IIM5_STRMM
MQTLFLFLGFAFEAPNVCQLTEFYPKGSLENVLSAHKVPLDWDVKFSILKDIARGMEYIHGSSIGSHGRLKSSNCMMDNRWSVRIGGFGLEIVRRSPKISENISNPTSMLWTSPELLREHFQLDDVMPGTKPGDVYSFAIIISELCTEDHPYALERNVLSTEEILILLKNLEDPANRGLRTTWISYGGSPTDNMRPAIHKSQLPVEPQEQRGLVQLMASCWKEFDALRPTFKEVLMQLNSIKPVKGDLVDILIKRLEQYSLKLEEQFVDASKELQIEKERLEELLGRLLPKKIVEDMIHGKKVEAEQFEMVTVCFSDISDFVSMAKELSPYEVINLLNGLYMCFDTIIENFDVYKVETVRDEYMVVSGLPVRNGYMHASEIAMLALNLMAAIVDFDARYTSVNRLLMLRIGMHSGPCVAGVVGLQMPRYCLFGDTVNTASRMKSSSTALQIHMSEATTNVLKIVGGFQYEYRGEREVKVERLIFDF